MELWMDLLFGNAVGLLSVITVTATAIIIGYLVSMIFWRANHPK